MSDERIAGAAEERRRYFTENIDRAVDEGWIKVFFQPVIRGSNGRVCCEEALARWAEPGKPVAYPDEFVPMLEDAGLIHKLDLYMIEGILKSLEERRAAGLYLVPISVNLSRADFDHCDMVEEIRRRVDGSGFGREMIYIEITESVLGSSFELMKGEIDRFRELGFRVCLDDFGSGYSSLDFLQKTDVDALKLDLNFMREFESSEKTRVIITQLIRLISALGMDTIAEGVESRAQFEFLREIGCTKMQGFYFCEAISAEEVIARYREGRQIGFEDPDEAAYYEAIGRISLFDLDAGEQEENTALQKFFETLPVAILEYDGESVHVVRCNKSYKKFVLETFGIDDSRLEKDHAPALRRNHAAIFELFERCRGMSRRLMFEERVSDSINISGFIRHSADNDKTGCSAYTVAILSNKDFDDSSGVTFARAARALSADYINLYYVNDKTDSFTEYNPDAEHSNLSVERHGMDFFNASRVDAEDAIYPEDLDRFLGDFRKDRMLSAIEERGTFTLLYRLMIDGEPIYVNMKAVRVDRDHIVIGVSNVDAYMRHKEALERAREESITYARITALAGNYIAIYTVDPSNGDYIEYSSTSAYEDLGLAKTGSDFFDETLRLAMDTVYAEDLEGFKVVCTKENILRDIEQTGLFEFSYRLMMEGEPVHVSLKAAVVEEKDGPRMIVGISNIEERIARSREYEDSLREARNLIMKDGLTGVKNKNAYLNAEAELNEQIAKGEQPEFAIIVADLNGLKEINDQHGHQTGDNFLRAGCRAICDVFDHSPVFRVGGDEFAVIARGRDYENIDALMREMAEHNERCIEGRRAASEGLSKEKQMTITAGSYDRDSRTERDYSEANAGDIFDFDPADVVIACGMARFDGDPNVASVFDRADLAMFEDKKELKSR